MTPTDRTALREARDQADADTPAADRPHWRNYSRELAGVSTRSPHGTTVSGLPSDAAAAQTQPTPAALAAAFKAGCGAMFDLCEKAEGYMPGESRWEISFAGMDSEFEHWCESQKGTV